MYKTVIFILYVISNANINIITYNIIVKIIILKKLIFLIL
jgi:hypothetical protein